MENLFPNLTSHSLFVPESLYRIDPGRAQGRIDGRDQTDDEREQDRARREIPWNREELDAPDRVSHLIQYRPVGERIRQAVNSPAAEHAQRPAGQSDQTRFDEEDSHDLAVRPADGFHDTDFARPFADGHDHRVRDAERRDQQRDAPDQRQRAVDDQEDSSDLFDLIGEAPGAEAALLDLFF